MLGAESNVSGIVIVSHMRYLPCEPGMCLTTALTVRSQAAWAFFFFSGSTIVAAHLQFPYQFTPYRDQHDSFTKTCVITYKEGKVPHFTLHGPSSDCGGSNN